MVIILVEYMLGKRELISFSDAESSYAGVTAPKVLLGRNAKWTPKDTAGWLDVKGAGTDSIEIDVREQGIKTSGGTLEFVPQNWKFLKFVLCETGAGVTDTGSAPTVHTFTNGKAGLPSFNLERAIKATTSRVRTYKGCQVNKFTLNFDAAGGGFVNCTADILARDVSTGTAVTSLTALTTEGFKARMATLVVNGSTEVRCLNGTLNIDNKLDDGRYANYANDNTLKSVSSPQVREVSGNLNINLTDDTYFTLWNNLVKVPGACSLTLTRATNDNIALTFTDFYIEDAPDPTNLEGINSVTVNFKAKSVTAVARDALTDYGTFA